VKVLQTLLGHKTATLTLDRYAHLFPEDLGAIADAFDVAAKTAADGLRTIRPLQAVPTGKITLNCYFSVPSVGFEPTLDGF
jgi:hypothetical protein